MRIITSIGCALAFLVGIGALALAFATPTVIYKISNNASMSAIQATQVYSEAMLYALLGIGALLASVVLAIVSYGSAIYDVNSGILNATDSTHRIFHNQAERRAKEKQVVD
jgi:hypothetical protein